jgi:hypothetical protein
MKMSARSDKENHNQNQIEVSRDEIVQWACQLWEAAGRPDGRDAEFWLQAEAKLLATAQRGHSLEVGTRPMKPKGKTTRPIASTVPG